MNNYAISSDGIATALETSASALYAAGNDMNKSVAMVAAANKVIQDPSQVGAALRTISLRLRGTEVKKMEEMGEDTDGLVSKSKMRSKVLSLSGVDILTDTGAYKDTYTIIKEIGQVWQDMSNIDQAALLELMAGKNRSNVMAALLTNIEDLEGAYQNAQQAGGSAYRENQEYLNSIQGKIDLFTNSVQTFWMNLLNSDLIKGALDQATALMNILDTLPGKLLAIGVAVSTIYKFKNKITYKDMFSGLVDNATAAFSNVKNIFYKGMQDISKVNISGQDLFGTLNQYGVNDSVTNGLKNIDGLTAKTKQLTISQKESVKAALAQRLANKELTADQYLCTVATLGLTDATQKEVMGSQEATASKITEAVATGKLSMANGIAALSSMGLASATNVAKVALAGLWNTIKAHPLMFIAAATSIVVKIFDSLIFTADEALEQSQQAFDGISSAVENTKSTLSDTINKLDEINQKISELDDKKLSFTDEQELQRLKEQRDELQGIIKTQEGVLESQNQAQANAAKTAMNDFLKSTSYGTDEAEKAGKKVGTAWGIGAGVAAAALIATGIAAAPFTGGGSLTLSSIGAAAMNHAGLMAGTVAAGGIIGNKTGGEIGVKLAENEGTYQSWYETYKTAYQEKQKAAEDARKKYEKSPSDMDAYDEWKEKEQAANEVQTEMYDKLSQMQQYYNNINYGINEETDRELDKYYNFLDKLNIDQGVSGAKKNALDRLLGANASGDIKQFKQNIDTLQKVKEEFDKSDKNGTKFDFTKISKDIPDAKENLEELGISVENLEEILEGDKDLTINIPPELKARMDELGISTDELSKYLDHVGEIGVGAFDDLSGAISDATQASDALNESLSAESNGGYETRDKALDEMQKLIDKGLVGSESNLWNIAEKYGFTYNSAKTIDENTKALQAFINARKKWYQVDEDGDITSAGADAFATTMNKVVNSDSKTGKALRDAGMSWNYEDGNLDFDFNNMNLDKIIETLSKTKELSGITKEEFIDMMTALGQFVDIDWANGNDIVSWVEALADGGASAKEQLEGMKDPLVSLLSDNGLKTDTIKEWLSTDMSLEDIKGTDVFKKLADDIQAAIEKYKELQDTGLSTREINEGTDKAQDAYSQLKNSNSMRFEQKQQLGSVKLDISDLDSKKDKIKSLNDSIDALQQVRRLGLSSEEAEYARTVLTDLIKRKQQLEAPAVMNVDTSKASEEIQEAVAKIQEYKTAYNELEMNKQLGVDTTEAEKKVNQLRTEISQLDDKTLASLGVDIDFNKSDANAKLNEAINSLNKKQLNAVKVKVRVDKKNVEDYKPGDKKAKTIYTVDDKKVAEWKKKNHDVKADITYTPHVEALTDAQKNKTGTITYRAQVDGPKVNGTAHAMGTAWAGGTALKGGKWGAKKTETALVGELGPEMVVRGDRWFTVGDQGAEFRNIQRGDIIFNHKQTEEIFKNGYITSRGKIAKANGTAHAQGTAFGGGDGGIKGYKPKKNYKPKTKNTSSNNNNNNKARNKGSNSSGFKEVFDWIEVKVEEINESLDLMAAKLKNAIDLTNEAKTGKNDLIEAMISTSLDEINTLEKGYKKYNNRANKILKSKNKKGKYIIPKKYWDEVKDGKISIETFKGKTDEKTLNKIKEYREWAQKAADLKKQIQEVNSEIAELAKQKFDNIEEAYNNMMEVYNRHPINRIQNYIDLTEEKGNIASAKSYEEMIRQEQAAKENLTTARDKMQQSLDESVKKGRIKKESPQWWEAVKAIQAMNEEIDAAELNIEKYNNAINEIKWKVFDTTISRIDGLSNETQNLIDLMGDVKDAVKPPDKESGWGADDVEWTNEGLTSLGLYAQQMEIAQEKAKQYQKAIEELDADYAAGKYSENEYYEKLAELKDGQYDAIKSYHDAKDAIVELNEARIDAIKAGIEREVEAYSELISKKKEELSAEKDLYDFQKNVRDQQKDIATIERKLLALSTDNSTSAMAKRRKLEAELAQAKQDLEDTYYERSVDNQQEMLDKNLESFEDEKDKEIKKLEKSLKDTEQLVKDSFKTIQQESGTILTTMEGYADKYGIKLSDSIKTAWGEGKKAMDEYYSDFEDHVANSNQTEENIGGVVNGIQNAQNAQDQAAANQNQTIQNDNATTTGAEKEEAPPSAKPSQPNKYPYGKVSSVSGNIDKGDKGKKVKALQDALNKLGYASPKLKIDGSFGPKTLEAVKKFQKKNKLTVDGIVGKKTKAKFKSKGYALGTTGIKEDQWALIDELGDELVLRPDGQGKLSYLTKGTAVIPHDISENLMKLGQINPQDLLDRNRPSIAPSEIVKNTEINLNIEYGDMLRIENFDGNNPEDVAKIVAKQFEKHTKRLNDSLRKFTR